MSQPPLSARPPRKSPTAFPPWFFYRIGPGYPLSDTVDSTALATGIVDTKIASVAATLTALRFVKRHKSS